MAKGKRGKKKPVRDPNALSEVETTFYELTIADIRRKIDRLEQLNEDHEKENLDLEKEVEETTEDQKDKVTIIKEALKERQDETVELKTSLDEIEETAEEEIVEHTKIIKELEEGYDMTRKTLRTEISQLVGKLSTLEEFKATRDSLKQKFEEKEKLMGEEDISHKRRLYENSRKFVIAKGALQKNMETKLFDLSTEFQEITEKAIPPSMHRMTRENIAIDNELNQMMRQHQKIYNEINARRNRRNAELIQNIKLAENETKEALSKVAVESQVLKSIRAEYAQLQKDLSECDARMEQYKTIVKDILSEREVVRSVSKKLNMLEQLLHAIICERASVKGEFGNTKEEYNWMSGRLLQALLQTKVVLKMQQMQYKSGPEFDRKSIVPRDLISILSEVKLAPPKPIRVVDAPKFERVLKDVEQQIGASYDEFTKEESTYETSAEIPLKSNDEDETFPDLT